MMMADADLMEGRTAGGEFAKLSKFPVSWVGWLGNRKGSSRLQQESNRENGKRRNKKGE